MNEKNTALDEAARWVTQSAAAAREQVALESWKAGDAQNADAHHTAMQAWRDLRAMREMPQYRALLGEPTLREKVFSMLGGPASFVRRPVLLAVGLTAAAAFAAVTLWHADVKRGAVKHVRTDVAEIRDLMLSDGSQITLGARSEIHYTFTEDARRVTLNGGDAFFSVAADPSRPFFVNAGSAWVRVLGTRFEVRHRGGHVNVAVLDGMVQVLGSSGEQGEILRQGQAVTVSNTIDVPPPNTVDVTDVAAWRGGRLVYDNVTLGEVVADANRYFEGSVVLGDPGLADMRVTTAFRSDQVDAMIQTLERALPLRAQRDSDGRIVLEARD